MSKEWRDRWARRLASVRIGRLSLRTRMVVLFAIGSLLLSGFLAAAAYSFTRSGVLNQRDRSGVDQAYRNAQVAQNELAAQTATAPVVIQRLRSLGVARAVVYVRGEWARTSASFDQDAVPATLRQRVIRDNTPARMITSVAGSPTLVIGIPLTVTNAAYFEFVDLSDSVDTLNTVRLSLLFGGLIATMFGGFVGALAANRAVKPLGDAARAARAFADGRLDTRLAPTEDQDLQALAGAFNEMASTLQSKVEREARFASDVSHELRSPLMTLAASIEVMRARRDEMPERAQSALDLMVADVSRFQGLVEDLLEISRFDAGAIRLHQEELGVAEFVRQAVAVSTLPQTPVVVSDVAETMLINGDRRRLARALANLIDNARKYGGSEVTVHVDAVPEGTHVHIAVEDNGPGVPEDERSVVFDRFSRGAVAGRRATTDGAGLGLALVDEHVRLHAGRVWVEDRSDGQQGARFVIELPAEIVALEHADVTAEEAR